VKTNWIVMPVRNCMALTKTAIQSCLEQDIGDVQVVVMDNGSTDGVLSYLRSVPQVQVVYAPPPMGVTAMWNEALEHLFGSGAEHVLVINNDVQLRSDTYRLLVQDGGSFVTSVGTSTDGAQFPGGTPTMARRPHPDFSCFLIRREAWEKVGKFDERMVIYCQDLDYHLRLHRAGIDAYCLDIPFYHYASGTLKSAEEGDRERILQQAQHDREQFKLKWGFEGGTDEYYQQFKEPQVVASTASLTTLL